MHNESLSFCIKCGKSAAFVRKKFPLFFKEGYEVKYYIECANCFNVLGYHRGFKTKEKAVSRWNDLYCDKIKGVKDESNS